MRDRLHASLQENLITVLCHDDANGKIVCGLIDTNLFEGDYRDIAERALQYWHEYQESPKAHTADLVADIIEDPQNRRAPTFRRILSNMLELQGSLNTTYVLDQLRQFTRLQRLKQAVLTSAEIINRPQVSTDEVESIWQSLLNTRDQAFDPGLSPREYEKVLEFMQARDREFEVGIPELDRANIVPARGALMLLLAPTGKGKTWWLIHLMKRAMAQRKRVVYVTYELSAELITMRLYQSLYGVPKWKAEGGIEVTDLRIDDRSRLVDIDVQTIHPDFALSSPNVGWELETRANLSGAKLDLARIKQFPPRSQTPNGLRAYLDTLESTENFIPDLLIVDMVSNMKTDARNHRIELGTNVVELRAIGVERNMAVASALQANRAGAESGHVKTTHVGEDWSMIGTADTVITYSCTDAEFRRGLARLYVGKGREEGDRFGLLITQNYKTGQFVLQSMPLRNKYWDLLNELKKRDDDAYDESDSDADGD